MPSEEAENPEIANGPGGVATPTPEPGGTPTPQPEPLKPLADLLGKTGDEPAAKTPEETRGRGRSCGEAEARRGSGAHSRADC